MKFKDIMTLFGQVTIICLFLYLLKATVKNYNIVKPYKESFKENMFGDEHDDDDDDDDSDYDDDDSDYDDDDSDDDDDDDDDDKKGSKKNKNKAIKKIKKQKKMNAKAIKKMKKQIKRGKDTNGNKLTVQGYDSLSSTLAKFQTNTNMINKQLSALQGGNSMPDVGDSMPDIGKGGPKIPSMF